jgi:hypothetical protein
MFVLLVLLLIAVIQLRIQEPEGCFRLKVRQEAATDV